MRSIVQKYILFSFMFFLLGSVSWSQGVPYEGPDDPAGDKSAEREGIMNGNRVYLYFQNTTELSKWVAGSNVDYSKWPNNSSGVRMLDGLGLLVGAQVFIDENGNPVEDPSTVSDPDLIDTLFYLQTSYREEMDTDLTGTVEWGFYPVFGYFNRNTDYPAMSNLESSWPPMGWPASGSTLKWPGEWNGRFGRGVIYADLETFFVVNDAQDQEYLGVEDLIKYYPRPGKFIGSDITIQPDKPWGGIGIRVEQRGFQWNNPQARDAIFWEYNIANISDYTLPSVAFGYWVDNGIGAAGEDDDYGYFDRDIDMAYSWDVDGIGFGGIPTGTMGFAYLESPGIPYDTEDNDGDGLTNEQRDNEALSIIGPTGGITDLAAFLDFYHLEMEDLRDHWDADEDQDWDSYDDANGNGQWDPGEAVNDDVGLDGVGPGDLNYEGPDADGTEANGRPDYRQGIGSEPDFNSTDVSESDMIGLTTFTMFPVPSHSSSYRWFRGDRSMWEVLGADTLVEYLGNISNLIEVFASGPFPLFQGRVERISMSELHSYDPLTGLNSDRHTAPSLFELKRVVQVIYEKDYRFAQPPLMPTLTATAGDGFVILTWDNVSDTKTRDPFLQNENDFEGYKLFRATDKQLSDPEIITDGFGTPILKKPIFQCDLIDDKLGFTDFGLVNGIGYYLGTETGITHYFKDETVTNGRTYYYALVAYDYGVPDLGPGISPSENSTIIDLDEYDNIRNYGKNIQIVTPHQEAAGYLPPEIEVEDRKSIGYGYVDPDILATGAITTDVIYKAYFDVKITDSIPDYNHGVLYVNDGFNVLNSQSGKVVYREDEEHYNEDNFVFDDGRNIWYIKSGSNLRSDVFDGLRILFNIDSYDPSLDYASSGWIVGEDYPIRIVPTSRESNFLAWNYEIFFTDDPNAYTSITPASDFRRIKDENDARATDILFGLSFPFYVMNMDFKNSLGTDYEILDLVGQDMNADGIFDIRDDRIFVGAIDSNNKWAGTAFIFDFRSAINEAEIPGDGDRYKVTFKRSFWKTDTTAFVIRKSAVIDPAALALTMKDIKVVPNPYVGTNLFETAVANRSLPQTRQIMFTHLPARCTIRIFTSSGVLVDIINVDNPEDNGTTYWDLVSKEGLAIAAGIYIYHVKATDTGDQFISKFAVIK